MSSLSWLADGMAEIERAAAAGEWNLAWLLAAFIDHRVGGRPATTRLMGLSFNERAAP